MQQSRLHRKLLIGIVVLFGMMGIGGMLSLAHADDNEHVTLSACNGDGASNPAGDDNENAYSPYFKPNKDKDTGEITYDYADDSSCTTCKLENGKLSSSDFQDYCDGVGKGEMTPGGVVKAMMDACSELKDGDENKANCEASARKMEGALTQCQGDKNHLLSGDTERRDVYESLMANYCMAACNVEYALEHGDTKGLWDKIKDVAKAIVGFVIDVLAFIANMLSCLFSGTTNVDTLPTRTHFVKVIWFGPIVRALLGGVNVVAYDTRDIVYGYATTLLGLGLAFWLLFRILKMAGSQKNVDLEAFLTDIGKAVMRAVVAWALLASYTGGIFDLLLVPIAESFSAATTMIVDAAGTGSSGDLCCGKNDDGTCVSTGSTNIEGILENAGMEEKIEAMLPQGKAIASKDGDDNIVLKLGRPIVEAITSVNTRLMMVMADGWALVKYGIMNAFLLCLIPRFNYILTGAVFMAFAGILALMIPLKYLDALIKMGIAICLTPFFITAWAFPSTRKYAFKGFNLFMHTFILVLVMSLAAVVCLTAINVSFGNFAGCDNASSIMDVINFESKDDTKNPVMYLLTMIVLLIACKKLIKSVPEIAGNISGAPGDTNIGDSLGQMIGKVGSKGAQAAGAVAGAAGNGIKSAASSAKNAFMKSPGGQAFMSKVQDSPVGHAAAKASAMLKAPGNAVRSFKSDLHDYRLAKQEDKGTVQGAALSVLGRKSLGDDTVAKLKEIGEGKGARAKIAVALLNKDHERKLKENIRNEATDIAEKAIKENAGDTVKNMEEKASPTSGVAKYLEEHNGKPSLFKSLKEEISKATGAGKPDAAEKGNSVAGNEVKPSDDGAKQGNVPEQKSGQDIQTTEKNSNAKGDSGNNAKGADDKNKGGDDGKAKGGADDKNKGGDDGKAKGDADDETKGGADDEAKGGADDEAKGGADDEAKGGADDEAKGSADDEAKGSADDETKGGADGETKGGNTDSNVKGTAKDNNQGAK